MKYLYTLSFLIVFLSLGFVDASLSPDSGVECKITAEVLETDLTHDRYSELAHEQQPRVGETTGGWTKIRVLEVEEGDFGIERLENFCGDTYPENMEIFVKIDKFPIGTVLQGNIRYTADEWMLTYFFRDLEVISLGSVAPPPADEQDPYSGRIPIILIVGILVLASVVVTVGILVSRRN